VTVATILDIAQARALEHPPDAALAIVGPAGSGKSTVLLERARRAASAGNVWLTAARARGVACLGTALGAAVRSSIRCAAFEEIALEIVRALAPERDVALISDVRAAQIFEDIGAKLFSLDWTEFVSAEIDPEITGLRTPERFASAAFRLIRRLRAAQISPEEFRAQALRGANKFYGKPPNFAGADLLTETPQKYRDSLRVSPAELARQYERELDLVKILAKLYESYVGSLVADGCMTAADAVYEATLLLRTHGAAKFNGYRYALVDDVQDLDGGQIALLVALYGERLERVTLSGDPRQTTLAFEGARGITLLDDGPAKIELQADYRAGGAIRDVVARLLESEPRTSAPTEAQPGEAPIEAFRAVDPDDEARYVAAAVARLVREGIAPERVAVIARNLSAAQGFVGALLARNVPIDVAGQVSLFDFTAVQDALAALWALNDPFRHDWLLRNLEAPWLALSDASIARLCDEPASPQEALFVLEEQPDDDGRRWDRRRDLRLGLNVTRGDVDDELSDEARRRLVAFRTALARWTDWERTLALPALVRAIFSETVMVACRDDARGRFDANVLERLLDGVDAFSARDPLAGLDDFLRYSQRIADADADLLVLEMRDGAAVAVLDIEAAKGREFDHVFVVEAQAGAFPRYYVPDAFLFAPSYGMIPKENVGADARAARTAKFTYALYALKAKERYNQQERRALYCAATRAKSRLYVSASGRPTRGQTTPEFLEELRNVLGQP
jgi:superfamily I DNA/RNA helicase